MKSIPLLLKRKFSSVRATLKSQLRKSSSLAFKYCSAEGTPHLLFNTNGEKVPCKVLSVYDGDTVNAAIEFPFIKGIYQYKVRLLGIDAPEMKPPLSIDKSAREEIMRKAVAARDRLQSLLCDDDDNVFVVIAGQDKYGRLLGTFFLDKSEKINSSVNDTMLREGLVSSYIL